MPIGPSSPDNKAIRELRDELKNLSQDIKKSTRVSEKLTILLAIVAILQLMVAVFQFTGVGHQLEGLILGLYTVGMAVVTFWLVTKEPKKKADKK